MRRLFFVEKQAPVPPGGWDSPCYSLADLDNLPDPDVLAEEIAENLESALGSFREMIAQLKK
jgi:hypothetical protein